MDLTPRTLREVQFRDKLRGYHQDDVDEFLERVAAALDVLLDRLRTAEDRVHRLEGRLAETTEGDDSIRRALSLAQKTADVAMDEARAQAGQIIGAANEQAQAIVASGEEHARQVYDGATVKVREEIAQLEGQRNQMMSDLELLARYLDNERSRLRMALSDALLRVEGAVPQVSPPPSTPGFAPTPS